MFFAKLGRWCCPPGQGRLALAGRTIVFGGISSMVGTAYSTEFALPDVESRRGFDILDEHFADSGGWRGRNDRVPCRAGRHRPRSPTSR